MIGEPRWMPWLTYGVLILGVVIIGFPGFTGFAMKLVPASHGGVVLGILPLVVAIFGSLAAAMAVVAQGNLRTAASSLKVSRAQSAAETAKLAKEKESAATPSTAIDCWKTARWCPTRLEARRNGSCAMPGWFPRTIRCRWFP